MLIIYTTYICDNIDNIKTLLAILKTMTIILLTCCIRNSNISFIQEMRFWTSTTDSGVKIPRIIERISLKKTYDNCLE